MQAEKQALMTRQIVGHSQSIKKILLQIEKLALVDSTVLVTGDSGVGKSLVAEVIHGSSLRKNVPLVKIDCSQLDKISIEKEVLSVIQPTHCVRPDNNLGRIYCQLLLEEIGDIPLPQQQDLLRLLEERQVHFGIGPLKRCVDLRIIATTHRNLSDMVSLRMFRKDLYYRLHVAEVKVPTLREHCEDIPVLVDYFIRHYNKKFNSKIAGVSPSGMKFLSRRPWFGNIRELQNLIEQAMIFCDDLTIRDNHLRPGLGITEGGITKEEIEFALKRAGGNKALAARSLGVSRRTIYRKLEEYDISDANNH